MSIMSEEINKKDEPKAHDFDDRSVSDDDVSYDDDSIVDTFVDCECLKERLSSVSNTLRLDVRNV